MSILNMDSAEKDSAFTEGGHRIRENAQLLCSVAAVRDRGFGVFQRNQYGLLRLYMRNVQQENLFRARNTARLSDVGIKHYAN